MNRLDKEKMMKRNGEAMQAYVDELANFVKPLSQVDNITVTVAVTSDDVTNSAADYYSGSVNQTKIIATFSSEEDADVAISTGVFDNAKTLSQFKYPKAGVKKVIDIS